MQIWLRIIYLLKLSPQLNDFADDPDGESSYFFGGKCERFIGGIDGDESDTIGVLFQSFTNGVVTIYHSNDDFTTAGGR